MIRKIMTGIFVGLLGLFVSLFIVEVIVRFFLIQGDSTTKWSDRPSFYFRSENAQTLQDYNYSPKKPSDTYRIAVVGDSYTFAPYMQFTDTFPKKLEQMLNMNQGVRKVEVINYGVPAYSTSHEVVVVDKAIAEGADLIILQITLNDPELKPYRPEGIDLSRPDKFGALQLNGIKAKVAHYWKTYQYVASRLHNTATHREYRQYFIDLWETPRSWNGFVKSFRLIKQACEKSNTRLVVSVFPLFGLPLDERYPFKIIHDKVGSFLNEEKIEFTDLYSAFAGLPIDRMQVIPGVDRHPNEIAHRIAAESIYLWLENANIIPNEFKIRVRYNERLGISGNGLMK